MATNITGFQIKDTNGNLALADGGTGASDATGCVLAYPYGTSAQISKVWAVSNQQHNEVWWFYPSGNATEVDRYVSLNYREGHWTTGRPLAGDPDIVALTALGIGAATEGVKANA